MTAVIDRPIPSVLRAAATIAGGRPSLRADSLRTAVRSTQAPVTTLGGRLAPSDGAGWFRVERPGSWLRRRVAGVLGLPAAGTDVAVTLQVVATERGDRWDRTFGRRHLVSHQRVESAAIVERVGPVELRFVVDPIAPLPACGLLSTGAALVLGPVRIALPRRVTPAISCRVTAGEGSHDVSVTVATCGGRVLCRYDGALWATTRPTTATVGSAT